MNGNDISICKTEQKWNKFVKNKSNVNNINKYKQNETDKQQQLYDHICGDICGDISYNKNNKNELDEIKEIILQIKKAINDIINDKDNKKIKEIIEEIKNILHEKSLIKSQNLKQEQFRLWLINNVGLGQYYDLLIQNGFDSLLTIKYATMNQLKFIGINKIGHRLTLIHHITKLKKTDNEKLLLIVSAFIAFLCIIFCFLK